jgi:hypothetical protein
MKLQIISKFASIAAVVAVLPLGASAFAASAALAPIDGDAVLQPVQLHVDFKWDDSNKRKLRKAYWILEQSDRNYHGHKAKAIEEIKKAGDIIGMDLHGEGYGGAKQEWSDARLREARDLLKEIAQDSGGREHEHLREAIHELDHALEHA